MTQRTLIDDLKKASVDLIELAGKISWNKVSENLTYIITEINYSEENAEIQRKKRNRENNGKTPRPIEELRTNLEKLYPEMYDINLSVNKAKRNETIIEIRYFQEDIWRMNIHNEPRRMPQCYTARFLTHRIIKKETNLTLTGNLEILCIGCEYFYYKLD